MSASPLRELLHEVRVTHQRYRIMVIVFEAIVLSFVVTTLLRTSLLILWGVESVFPFLLIFPIIAAMYVVLRFPPPLNLVHAARLVDQRLDLKDRMATAIEWEGKSSKLVPYLSDDAAMHARFAQTSDVTPPPSWFGRKRVWQWFLIIAVATLWVIPLPTGLALSPEFSLLSDATSADQEDDLLGEVDELLEQIQALSPQVQERLQRDLAEIRVGLRDRSLPQEDARALIRHLERRIESARANQPPALEQGLSIERGDTLQFADHLSPSAFPTSTEAQRLQTAEIRQETAMIQEEWGEETAEPQPDGQQTPESPGDEPGPGGGGAFPDLGDSGPDAGEPPDLSEAPEDETSGTGSLPGHGPGEGGETESFERPDRSGVLQHVQGDQQTGPIRVGNIQLSPDVHASSPSTVGLQMNALTPGEDGLSGVQRERIPLAYRDLIRRYFEHLEPQN